MHAFIILETAAVDTANKVVVMGADDPAKRAKKSILMENLTISDFVVISCEHKL